MNAIAGSASLYNLKKSIINPINLDNIAQYLPSNAIEALKSIYPDRKIYMWALSNGKNYTNKFNKISNGDILLLKENEQRERKFFNYTGRVVYKIEVQTDIGDAVWKSPKWTRLFFLNDVYEIEIEDKTISRLLGYQENLVYQNTVVVPLSPETAQELLGLIEKYKINKLNRNK